MLAVSFFIVLERKPQNLLQKEDLCDKITLNKDLALARLDKKRNGDRYVHHLRCF